MKKLLFLLLILGLSLSLKAEQPKHVILSFGISPYFETGMLSVETGIVMRNNIYVGLDFQHGVKKVAWYPWRQENKYYRYSTSRNFHFGYLFRKVYISSIIGYTHYEEVHGFEDRKEILYLNYGGEIGLLLNGIILSTGYSNPNGLSFKLGVLIDKL